MRYFKRRWIAIILTIAAVGACWLVGCGGGGDNPGNGGGDNPGNGGTTTSFTVTFDPAGGAVTPTSGTTGTDGKLVSLPTPTRVGYTFNGWFTESVGGSTVTTNMVFPANTVVYAQWTLNSYAVIWDTDGGTPVPAQTDVGHGGSIAQPAAMTKSGYAFDGWYTDSDLSTSAVFPITDVTEDKTFYAGWTLNGYTVTWNADGGTPVPTQTGVDHGGSIAQPAAMTKVGHTFGGWYTNPALTSAVSFPMTNVTENKTFYAKWTLNDYTVTWNADGGTPIPAQTGVDHGGSITQPAAMMKTGYTFGGWYTNSALTSTVSFPVANVTENKIFYAKWTLNVYTVTWNADGGTPRPVQTGVDHGGSIAQPAEMTKTGYIFGGWYTNSAFMTAVSFPVTYVTENKTFYAKWTHTVTWNTDGGTPIPTQTGIDHGGSIAQPAAMIKTGYTFDGWYTNSALTTEVLFPVTNVTENKTFYAKWTCTICYTVTYNGNGTTIGVPIAVSVSSGSNITLSNMTMTRTGYDFGGWNTSNYGTGTDYTAGSTYNVTEDVTFYAKWMFTDVRDNKQYRTTTIDGKTWMAENLNYQTSSGSWCYENKTDNCVDYGRMYDWNTAKMVCPTGWHLPSLNEWEALVDFAGGYYVGGKKLKAKSGWNWNKDDNVSGNGTDTYGFSALPGGERLRGDDDRFSGAGNYGVWWTASWAANPVAGADAFGRAMGYNSDAVTILLSDGPNSTTNGKGRGFSVRCLQD